MVMGLGSDERVKCDLTNKVRGDVNQNALQKFDVSSISLTHN